MAMTAVPGIAVEIDGIADISPLVASAFVMLRFGDLGDMAFVEIADTAGATPLPRQGASVRITVADIEVFRGQVDRVTGEGNDTGRNLQIYSIARSNPPATNPPPLACVWGQNLVKWNVSAKRGPAASNPRGETDLGNGELTLTIHPAARPGMKVTLAGTRAQFDGDYIVNTVGHKFNLGSGFSTELTIGRPSADD